MTDIVVMLGRFLLCFSLLLGSFFPVLAARAAEPESRQLLAETLLRAAGTAAVFDSPAVQAALTSPQPFLGEAGAARLWGLLADAGLRPWQPPRVWLLQAQKHDAELRWENLEPRMAAMAHVRGYALSPSLPLASAEEAIRYLVPGQPHPGLPGLLAAYEADVLVLLQGEQWTVWGLDQVLEGRLPTGRSDLLPDVLAEVLSSAQQWQEAGGRPLVRVTGVNGLKDFAGVQAALQALPGARQVQLVHVRPGQLLFTLASPVGEPLRTALDNDVRLPAVLTPLAGLPARIGEARRVAAKSYSRVWQPDLVPASAIPALLP